MDAKYFPIGRKHERQNHPLDLGWMPYRVRAPFFYNAALVPSTSFFIPGTLVGHAGDLGDHERVGHSRAAGVLLQQAQYSRSD